MRVGDRVVHVYSGRTGTVVQIPTRNIVEVQFDDESAGFITAVMKGDLLLDTATTQAPPPRLPVGQQLEFDLSTGQVAGATTTTPHKYGAGYSFIEEELTPDWFPHKPHAELWKREGRCPTCGEKGAFDRSLSMICSKHGVY